MQDMKRLLKYLGPYRKDMLIGALLIAMIRNGLNLMGASNDVQYIVIGAVIILAVTVDVFRNKAEAKARKMAAL